MKAKDKIKQSKHQYALIAILLIGCAVRILWVGKIPYGLNQDEASSGYEAFSLITYGIDRNGYTNPIHLLSWGSGQNMAYSWLCIPFIALLGLNVTALRLPMAIIGCISIYIFYIIFKTLWNEKTALWGCFFFAIYPWHIIKSRWALESNIFPDLVLWGACLLVLYIKKGKPLYLYLSVLLLSFSLYSYGTAYLFMPLFVGGVWLYMLCNKKINIKHFIFSALLFFITALPIMLFVLINIFDMPEIQFLNFSIPKLHQHRFATLTGTGDNFTNGCINNLKTLITLFINQGDCLSWNSIKNYGICYFIFVPLIPIGIGINLFEKRKDSFIFHWWFVCALIIAAVTKINVNRINIIFIPVAYYITVSIAFFAKQHRSVNATCVSICVVLFVLFGKEYKEQINTLKYDFFYSYEDAFKLANSYDAEKIYISTDAQYTLALFYSQIDPNVYLNTRVVTVPNVEYEVIGSFDRYYFYLPTIIDKNENAVYMVKNSNLDLFDTNDFEVISFFNYSVAVPKK